MLGKNIKYILVILSLFISLRAQNQVFVPEDYRNVEITAIRLEQPLKIDGILDEIFYTTKANGPFIQYEPNNGVLASEETKVWIGYDNNALYIGAMMNDSNPDSIVARMSRRDPNGENSDLLYMVIDSYFDRRSGFWFGINPIGSIADGTVSNDSDFDDSWDGIWEGQGRINDKGWCSEVRIPFSQLRFNKADENLMGIGFGRRIHRKEEMDFLTYIPRDESGMVSHFATLRGIKNINPPKRLETTPYFTGNYGNLITEKDNPFLKGENSSVNIGTDLKIGIGNNLTVDATINPDFGQVEVDPSELNLTAFETFYQEKRPFFVEGSNIFRFGVGGPTNRMNFGTMEPIFFYSRRIGKYPSYGEDIEGDWLKVPSATSIIGAAKLSGKITDTWSIGGFSAVTNREIADVQTDGKNSKVDVEPLTSYNLFRTLKEFNGGRQGLGIIYTFVDRKFEDETLRDILSDNSTVLGIDGWTFLNKNKDWVIGSWLGYSNIKGGSNYIYDLQQSSARYYQRPDADHLDIDPDATNLNGFAGKININKEKGNWIVNSSVQVISPGFENNDMGLNFKSDKINNHIAIGYQWLEPRKIFQVANLSSAYMSNHNFAGDKLNEMIFLFGFARFNNFWTINPIIGIGRETISDQTLWGGPLVTEPAGIWSRIFIRTDSRKSTIFNFGIEYSNDVEDNNTINISPGIETNLGTRLRMQFDPNIDLQHYLAQYIDVFEDDTAIEMFGNRYIVAQLDRKTISAELRFDYTFTPKLSFQTYLQPYLTVGSYSHYKEFKKPKSYDFVEYGKDDNMKITVDGEDGYYLYPNGAGGNSLYIENPDFNYKAFVSSVVLRWECFPGSTLFLVWTRNSSDEQNPGNFKFNRDLNDLLIADTDNVFAIKFTYWFGK